MADVMLEVGRAWRGRSEAHLPMINGGVGNRDPERSDDDGLEGT
jgi:hypothetical protein